MASLFFPQLSSGAIAQYPITKTMSFRNVQNVLPDGTMITYPDSSASMLSWQLSYSALSEADLQVLQAHFSTCVGPFRAFTFIDPTENMLVSSSNLTATNWVSSPDLKTSSGTPDPIGGLGAFLLTNPGQIAGTISQQVAVPSNYQYCFSIYAMSAEPSTITLTRTGSEATASTTFEIGPAWSRIVSSGRLGDSGTGIAVTIGVPAGHQVEVFGPQLEAQIAPSRFRPTTTRGGVFPNAHWASDQISVIAEGPNAFFTSFSIESVI